MAIYKKQLTPEQALQKLRHYCGYQERCHQDVTEKLYHLGIRKALHGDIIAALITDGYLNEERFAMAYAGGKFRVNNWGRVKINYGLRQKQVSDYCIKKAMKVIEEEDYEALLQKLALEKYTSLRSEQQLVRKKKTFDYLLQRGFERSLVEDCLNRMAAKGS